MTLKPGSLHPPQHDEPPRIERRAEPRKSNAGTVVLETIGPGSRRIHGKLVDVSAHGFRMRHSYFGLTPGDEVIVAEGIAARRLRVVWTRIFENRVESGFLVLE
jgi:hypothetical protein